MLSIGRGAWFRQKYMGRSPTGDCIGWHGLSEDEFRVKLAEYQEKVLDENS